MANRKRKAHNTDMYIALYLSQKEALEEDRNGLLAIQVFDHTLDNLDGLNALDDDNDFQDGDVLDMPVTIRVCKRKPERKRDTSKSRKATAINRNAPANTEAPAEDIPF